MADIFDPSRDIDVLKSGAFGASAAASAAVAEQARLSTEAIRNERILEEQRKRQLIRDAEERAAAARRQAELDREIERRVPEFLERVFDITNSDDLTSAQILREIGELQKNPDYINVVTDPRVEKVVGAYVSPLEKQIEDAAAGAAEGEKLNLAVAERLLASGNLKEAQKAAENIQDLVVRENFLAKITTERQSKKGTRTTAKRAIFDAAVKDAETSITNLIKFTAPSPEVDAEAEADSVASPADSDGEDKVNPVFASFNLAKSNLKALLGPEETEKLFKEVDPTNPAALEELAQRSREEVAKLRGKITRKPRTLRDWNSQEGLKESKTPKPAPASGSGSGSGSGGGFN